MAAVVLFSVVACGDKTETPEKTPAELLIGMWYPTTMTGVLKDQAGKDSTTVTELYDEYEVLEFLNGGVAKHSNAITTQPGTWKLEGDKITVKDDAAEAGMTYTLSISENSMTLAYIDEEGASSITLARTTAADMKSQPLVGEWKIMTAQGFDAEGELTGKPMDLSTANIIAKFLKNGYFGDSLNAIGVGTWTATATELTVKIPAGVKPAVEMSAPYSIATVDGVETLTARLNVAMLGGALMEAKLVRATAPAAPEQH